MCSQGSHPWGTQAFSGKHDQPGYENEDYRERGRLADVGLTRS